MRMKHFWTLGLVALAVSAGAASCSDRFEGCDKTLTCPDSSTGGTIGHLAAPT